jgi:mono/diheme cytochrome c family protein
MPPTRRFVWLLGLLGALAMGCGDGGEDRPVETHPGSAANGKKVYDKRCSHCHGDEGEADGPGAEFMNPRPRNFKNQPFKVRTTPSGKLPTDRDLFDIITRGIPGTSMPGFDMLAEQERWDLTVYVKSLSELFADPDNLSDLGSPEAADTARELDEAYLAAQALEPATEPELSDGQAMYQKNCASCHGNHGRGNGAGWEERKFDWDQPDRPAPIMTADLTNPESLRGGSSAYDLFRTITTGLNGTPMPGYRDNLSAEDRWKLVRYVQSFFPPGDQKGEVIVARRLETLPPETDPAAWEALWSETRATRFPTLPNLIEPPRLFWNTVEFITAQAVYVTPTEGAGKLVMRVQWNDRSESRRSESRGSEGSTPYADRDTRFFFGKDAAGKFRTTDHPDQLALQFPVKRNDNVRPYFLFGDGKRAVNLWWWDAAGDRLVEKNAKGYGSIADQPEQSQRALGKVTYEDGRYTLIVERELASPDKNDVQFETGVFTPLAFHVWDGALGNLGQRRSLTTWYWLYLEAEVPRSVYAVPPFAYFMSLALLLVIVAAVRRAAGVTKKHS